MDKTVAKELTAKENEEKLEAFKTELKKNQFIEEIRSGLGTQIKQNPRTIKKIKKPWKERVGLFLSELFRKF